MLTHGRDGSNVRIVASEAPPIMVRASVDEDEWRRFRSIAILENKAVQDLMAELIRAKIKQEGNA